MDPPLLTGNAGFPNVVSYAAEALWYAGSVDCVTYGKPPWCGVTFTFTLAGAILIKCWVNFFVMASGS